MASNPTISRLCIYPIKSLDGLEVSETKLFPVGGGLFGDRLWAIFDSSGKAVTGKTEPKIYGLRATFESGLRALILKYEGVTKEFSLAEGSLEPLNKYLSTVLGKPVTLRRCNSKGFPDSTSSPGPSIAGLESFRRVGDWFGGLELAEVRRRFRVSVEISGVEAFWEDRLFGESGSPKSFYAGAVLFHGMGPCMRCPVPVRNPDTGEIFKGFQRKFIQMRRATVGGREGVAEDRLADSYYLAVKTKVPNPEGQVIRMGDQISFNGPTKS